MVLSCALMLITWELYTDALVASVYTPQMTTIATEYTLGGYAYAPRKC